MTKTMKRGVDEVGGRGHNGWTEAWIGGWTNGFQMYAHHRAPWSCVPTIEALIESQGRIYGVVGPHVPFWEQKIYPSILIKPKYKANAYSR
jgi:hypothetical protein